jgi:hypothetical protein
MRHGRRKQENVRPGPTARVWQRLAEPAGEEFCQALWVGKYLFIDVDHTLCSKHGVEGVQCSEMRFGPSRSLSSLRALD